MKSCFLITICVFALSCQSEISLPEAPQELIPLEEMHRVLADISTLEVLIDKEYQALGKYYQILDVSVVEYLKEKNISEELFRKSLDHYNGHHEMGQQMYQDVIDTLTIRLELLRKKN